MGHDEFGARNLYSLGVGGGGGSGNGTLVKVVVVVVLVAVGAAGGGVGGGSPKPQILQLVTHELSTTENAPISETLTPHSLNPKP